MSEILLYLDSGHFIKYLFGLKYVYTTYKCVEVDFFVKWEYIWYERFDKLHTIWIVVNE